MLTHTHVISPDISEYYIRTSYYTPETKQISKIEIILDRNYSI